MRDRLRRWADDPIVIPRGSMVTKYVFTTLLGIAVAIATAPTLDQVTSASYSSFWALGIVLIFGGDIERLAYSVIVLGFLVFPTTRIVTLIRRGGSDA